MLKTLLHVLGFTAFLLGCAAKPAGDKVVPAATKGRPDASTQVLDASTQTLQNERDAGPQNDSNAMRDTGPGEQQEAGSTGVTAACDGMRCERQGNELAQSLMNPAAFAISCKGGDCARVDIMGVVAGMACTCQTSNGWIYIGPEGAGCFVRGRAGDCLWDDSEFKACRQGDPTCPAMCEALEKRYEADAAKSFDVELRVSECRGGSCRHVLRIENACYTDRSVASGRRFDCTLSDSEILDREDQAQ